MRLIWQQYGHILRKGHSNPATQHMWAAPHGSLITLLAIFTRPVIASLSTLRCLEGQMLYSRWGDYNTKISASVVYIPFLGVVRVAYPIVWFLTSNPL